MTRNTKITLGVLLLFGLIILALYLNNRRYMPKYSWGQNYVYTNDQPYGTKILYKLLESYTDGGLELIDEENVRSFLNDRDTVTPASYIVIGNHCNYETDDVIALKNFARKGNTVFIALEDMPYTFLEEIHDDCFSEWYQNTSSYHKNISANFTDSTLRSKVPYKFFYKSNDIKTTYYWQYFDDNFCDGKVRTETLGIFRPGEANFISFKLGKGKIVLHSTPLMFTNLHLIRPDAKAYTEKVLSYLPEGPIYWDRNSKLWSITNDYSSNKEQSPFSYILKQRAFKWAFYILWIAVFIFLVFNLWRKQREIPVKFAKSNSTLEFIHTIGELYFSQKDNKNLALQKMDLFLKSLRSRYNIPEKDEEKFIVLLAKKSEVPLEQIQNIFTKYKHIKDQSTEVSDEELISFYKSLESFNKNSK